MPTCLKCDNKFKNIEKIDGIKRNLSKRKYCLKCSPFKVFNRKKLHLDQSLEEKDKFCKVCKQSKPIDKFYQSKNKIHTYCADCHNQLICHRMKSFKILCVEYKGGKCEKCEYNKCINALEFHHVESEEKEFQISYAKRKKFDESIKKELDKCLLLCSNCHREVHFVPPNQMFIDFLIKAHSYNS